jgi:hypothetical protein
MRLYQSLRKSLLLTLGGTVLAASLSSAIVFSVSMDTTPLIGDPAAPFSLLFQFADGSGTGNGNNLVQIYNFNFGTGGPTGVPTISGGASGSLNANVSLTDTDPGNNYLFQSFTPGSNLFFWVNMWDVAETPQADEFTMSILDSNSFPVPTLDGADVLFWVDSGTGTLSYATFASDAGVIPPPDFPLAAPILNFVPEPSLVVLLGLGAILTRWAARRRA